MLSDRNGKRLKRGRVNWGQVSHVTLMKTMT